MTTKLKIDLTQGVLEVEGSETFVKTIYTDFKNHFINENHVSTTETPSEESPSNPEPRRSKAPRASRTKSQPVVEEMVALPTAPETTAPLVETMPPPATAEAKSAKRKSLSATLPHNLVPNLNLQAEKGRPALTEFTDLKFPITHEERILVFVYYLQEILKLDTITIDHITICYLEMKIRIPPNLQNSLEQTATGHGWIDLNNGNLEITTAGRDYVEKRLPIKR
jgi:hypothetical protein